MSIHETPKKTDIEAIKREHQKETILMLLKHEREIALAQVYDARESVRRAETHLKSLNLQLVKDEGE